jgi:hypothetical protein
MSVVRCKDPRVVTEQAVLDVTAGREDEFEVAFAEAKAIIASMPGIRVTPARPMGASRRPHGGFRASPEYEDWRRLLHHFYEPFPTVEHFSLVARV